MNEKRNEVALALGLAMIAAMEHAQGSAPVETQVAQKNEEVDTKTKTTSKRQSAAAKKEAEAAQANDDVAADENEITLATVEAAIADARSKHTPAAVRAIVKSVAGTPAASSIDPSKYKDVIEALAGMGSDETSEAKSDVHPDEARRGEMEDLLSQVKDEFGLEEAKTIIETIGKADMMADIHADNIVAVIEDCKDALAE